MTVSIVQVENTEQNAKNPSKATQKRNQTSLSSPQGETFFDCLIVMPSLKPKNSLPLSAVIKIGIFLNLFFSSRLTVKLDKLTVITGGTIFLTIEHSV